MRYPYANSCLIQFAKAPEVGKVKTRLHPALGAAGAAELHRQLVKHTFTTLVESQLAPVWLKVVNQRAAFFDELVVNTDVPVLEQQGSDLGERMYLAACEALQPYHSVVIVGSDCPFIDGEYLSEALRLLDAGHEVVIGPAEDGGYVLIGLRRLDKRLFQGVEWGTDQVMATTRQRLSQLGWDWQELAVLSDIDRPDDLKRLQSLKNFIEFY